MCTAVSHYNEDIVRMASLGLSGLTVLAGVVYAILAATSKVMQKKKVPEVEKWMLGVEITGSEYLDRPRCKQAASYAAQAHAGMIRKSGQPYVMHCIETAIITEQIIRMHFSNEIGNRCAACVVCKHDSGT